MRLNFYWLIQLLAKYLFSCFIVVAGSIELGYCQTIPEYTLAKENAVAEIPGRVIHTNADTSTLYLYLPETFTKYEENAQDIFQGAISVFSANDTLYTLEAEYKFATWFKFALADNNRLILMFEFPLKIKGRYGILYKINCIDINYTGLGFIPTEKTADNSPLKLELVTKEFLMPVPPGPLQLNKDYILRSVDTYETQNTFSVSKLPSVRFDPVNGLFKIKYDDEQINHRLFQDTILNFANNTALILNPANPSVQKQKEQHYFFTESSNANSSLPPEVIGLLFAGDEFGQAYLQHDNNAILKMVRNKKWHNTPVTEVLQERLNTVTTNYSNQALGYQMPSGVLYLLRGSPTKKRWTPNKELWIYEGATNEVYNINALTEHDVLSARKIALSEIK